MGSAAAVEMLKTPATTASTDTNRLFMDAPNDSSECIPPFRTDGKINRCYRITLSANGRWAPPLSRPAASAELRREADVVALQALDHHLEAPGLDHPLQPVVAVLALEEAL